MWRRGPASALGQPLASTSGRSGGPRCIVRCSYEGGIKRPPSRPAAGAGNAGGGGGGSSSSASSADALRSINAPRPLSVGYSGPRLASRPDLGTGRTQVADAARGAVAFDDNDVRMAAYDAMEVTVTRCGGDSSGAGPAAAAEAAAAAGAAEGGVVAAAAGGGGGGWGVEEARLESFNGLQGPRHLLGRMKKARLNRPTPIQSAAIPALLAGYDALIAAPPGSGATAAYLVPLLMSLHRLQRRRTRNRAYPPAVVLAPSRELAQQVAAEAGRLCEGGKLKVVCATGGAEAAPQRLALRGGCDLLVVTPGRLLDLLRRRSASLAQLRWLVVEEAEALLAPGMDAAVRDIAALHLSARAGGAAGGAEAAAGAGGGAEAAAAAPGAPLQTVLVASSAADAAALRAAAADLLRPGGASVVVAGALPGGPASSPAVPGARQRVVGVAGKLKSRALLRLLSDAAASGGAALVCCASAAAAGRVADVLSAAGVPSGLLHAGRSQAERDEAIQCFRFGVTRVLVSCGVAARGLDLPDVTHVINFDPPADEVEYAKRLARLGRGAGAAAAGGAAVGAGGAGGGATTLVCPEDAPRAGALVRALRAAGAAPPDWLEEMAEQHARGAAAGGGAGPGGGAYGGGLAAAAAGNPGAAAEEEEEEAAGRRPGRTFTVRRRAAGARFGAYIPLQQQPGAARGPGGGGAPGSGGAQAVGSGS